MSGFESIGRLLLVFGGVMVVLGLAFLLAGRLPIPFLGRLPGDIVVERESFTFYFPIVTMLVVSAVLTVLLNIVFRIFR